MQLKATQATNIKCSNLRCEPSFLSEHSNLQVKVVDYKEQCQTMENRLLEVNLLANQSQLQLNDTTNVIKSLEERLKTTEVNYAVYILFFFSHRLDLFFWCNNENVIYGRNIISCIWKLVGFRLVCGVVDFGLTSLGSYIIHVDCKRI